MNADPAQAWRIVVGVDASRHAAAAADWAAAEAAGRRVPLHVIHALDADPGSALFGFGYYPVSIQETMSIQQAVSIQETVSIQEAGAIHEPAAVHETSAPGEQLIAEVKSRLLTAHPGLEVTAEVVIEPAAAALVKASREAELVVVGSRGCGGFAGLPLGSVSARLAAHALCTTVVLRPGGCGHDYGHHHRSSYSYSQGGPSAAGEIVLGMQAQAQQDEEPILFAFTHAAQHGGSVRALRAWAPYPAHARDDVDDSDSRARHAAECVAAELLAVREKFPDVPVRVCTHRGHPSAVLADASAHARLVVVGAHRRRAPLTLGLGPVIHGLLAQARSPVAVVPIHDFE